MRNARIFVLQALALGAVALLLFGLGLRLRDGELVALVAGPSLIAPAIFWARRRSSGAS